jgi:hypothetical protein
MLYKIKTPVKYGYFFVNKFVRLHSNSQKKPLNQNANEQQITVK